MLLTNWNAAARNRARRSRISYRTTNGTGTVTYHAVGMSSDSSDGRPYRYKAPVLEALARHGLAPKPATSPERLRECVNDLYRYELRQLRERLLRREFVREEYSARVIEVRKRYWLMSVPPQFWTE